MTITENLQMGAHIRRDKAAIEEDLERVFGILPALAAAAAWLSFR